MCITSLLGISWAAGPMLHDYAGRAFAFLGFKWIETPRVQLVPCGAELIARTQLKRPQRRALESPSGNAGALCCPVHSACGGHLREASFDVRNEA